VKVVVDIVGGARAGTRLEFAEPETVRIGRHPDCDVAFDAAADLDASSRHAELRREKEGYVLYDLDSANGTRQGGEKLRRARITEGAEVEFGKGGPRCVFHFEGALLDAAPAPTAPTAPPDARTIGRTGRELRAYLRDGLARSTRGFKVAIVALGAALLGLAALVFVLLRSRRPEEAIRRELLEVMDRQRTANSDELSKKLAELNRELERARAASGGREVARASRDSVFLVAARGALGQEDGFCTAFVLAPHELATNAHCVVLADSLHKRGAHIWAVKNGDGRVRFEVTRMRKSREYVSGKGAITPDVGLLHVDGDLPARGAFADRAALQQLQPGDVIYTYGFPGRLADTDAPEATFVQGVVGRITRLDGESGDFDDRYLIQHSAFTAGGTSGSPIFDSAGRVVAVNAGGYVEDDELEVKDPHSGRPASMVVAQPLAGYNFGMRIDLVEALLREANP
jgi:hypothetical protein